MQTDSVQIDPDHFTQHFYERLKFINNNNIYNFREDKAGKCIYLCDDKHIITTNTEYEYDTILSYITYKHSYYYMHPNGQALLEKVSQYLEQNNIMIGSCNIHKNISDIEIRIIYSNFNREYFTFDKNNTYVFKLFDIIGELQEYKSNISDFNILHNIKHIANKYKLTPYIGTKEKMVYYIAIDYVNPDGVQIPLSLPFSNEKYGQQLLDYINNHNENDD
jgi:hypothetical protein